MLLRFFRDQAVEPLLGLALISAAIIGAGYGLTTHSSPVVQVVGFVLLAIGVLLALITAWVFLQLLYEHFISPLKVRLQFPLRFPVRFGEDEKPPVVQVPSPPEIVEKVVEVKPPDYEFLRGVKSRNDTLIKGGGAFRLIEAGLRASVHLETLNPTLTISARYRNYSIYDFRVSRVEGHVYLVGEKGHFDQIHSWHLGDSNGAKAQSEFGLSVEFTLQYETMVNRLRELVANNSELEWDMRHLSIWFESNQADALGEVKVVFAGDEPRMIPTTK